MIRNLKFLGLALVAALAMSSALANMASADVLTSELAFKTTIDGKQGGTDVFKVHGGEVKCATVTYTGSFTTGASSAEVTPTYDNCTFAGLAATIDMNECKYRISITGGTSTAGSVDIVCIGTNEITVTAPKVGTKKCIVHVAGQADLTNATVTNVGTSTTKELTLDINITNINYSQTAGMAETGNCKAAEDTTGGTYTGDATFTGSIGGVHVGIFAS
jgi:hypothetical protein